jgi:predicted phage-related endonuclease
MEQQQDEHVREYERHNLTVQDYPDRDTWLLARRTLLTSTDVGAIAGVDRFSSALKVYEEKLRPEDDLADDASDRMLVGRAMQDGIAEGYRVLRMKHEGRDIYVETVPATRLYLSGRWPMHAASMDCWQLEQIGGKPRNIPLEIKSWVGRLDEPLESWLTQVQWQMHVTGTSAAVIACGHGFGEIQWWDIERDDEIIDALVVDAERFWEMHVKPGIPPESDGSESASRALRKLYPAESPGLAVEFDMEDLDVAVAIASYAEQAKLMEQQKRALEDRLKAKMEHAEVAYLPNGQRVTWKTVHRKAHMVKESQSRQFRIWPAKK